MPYKDPEAQKKAQREQMRQRRAQAKAAKPAVDNLPMAADAPASDIPGQQAPTMLAQKAEPAPATQKPDDLLLKALGDVKVTSAKHGKATTVPLEPSPRAKPPAISSFHFRYSNNPAERLGIVVGSEPPGGYWTRFPGEQGRDCFNDKAFRCCYDLNFPVPWNRYYCPCGPVTCNYSKSKDLFELAGVK